MLRTWDGVAVELKAHLDRLYATAAWLRMQVIERVKLEEAVYRTIAAASSLDDHRIRVVLTRGPGSLAQPFAELGRGRAIVMVEPLPPPPTAISLATVDWPLAHPATGSPGGHKTLAYLDAVISRELALAAGADEAIRLDPKGHVVEGATCNVFVVESGTVATPRLDEGALPGIVRARVLELCAEERLTAIQRVISIRDLRGADEIFVTSSLRGVVAATRFDGLSRPAGPVTSQLARAYERAMRSVP
ncbi:MAG: aminotransferase class IV [Deltaproteobacteria bacterium]|nr:aminotransferase class IV [Deltaproteobacteria bacterium]